MTSNAEAMFNSRALSAANGAVGVAQSRGWTIPEHVMQALDVCRELSKIHTAPAIPAHPPLPAKASEVRKALTQHADTLEADRRLRATAEQLMGPAAARYAATTRDAMPAWIDTLADEFATAWATFKEVAPTAPVTIEAGIVDESAVAAYAATANAAAALDSALTMRTQLGQYGGEEGCDDGKFIGIVAAMPPLPRDPADFDGQWQRWSRVTSSQPGVQFTALRQMELQNLPESEQPAWSALSQGPLRWRRLMALEADGWIVRLARTGEVERRMVDLATWQQAAWDVNTTLGGTGNYGANLARGRYRVSADAQTTAA